MPEGLKQQLIRQHDKMHQVNDARGHDERALLMELSSDNLQTFERIVGTISQQSENEYAAFLQGAAAMVLDLQYNICFGCHRNHDIEAAEVMQAEAEKNTAAAEGVPGPIIGDLSPRTVVELWEAGREDWPMLGDFPDDVASYFDDWGVSAVVDQFPKVQCNECGLEYKSLSDRMLKKPMLDGCHGCQMKSARG